MAKSSEYRMAIKIAGEIEKSLYNCTDLTRKELNKIAREAANASTSTKGAFEQGLKQSEPFFNSLEKVGVKAFKAVAAAAATAGTAIIGIGTMAAQEGIEFESAFAGVKKTTTATAEEYAQMREEIIAMTRDIPTSVDEISEVAEAAGQLGIGKENLLSFSRTMIDLGESTNLASTEAASDLAKFANITGMSADNYSNLGSVIVDLGNNFATTESDIVSMATRLASAGELAGFTEAQIMAMATAMSSVGIEAEAGGSSMSKIIKKVQVAVETGSDSLEDYASVAGMSVDEFKKEFQKDGLAAVSAFISGLNDIERNGKSATVLLDEMGLTQVNVSNALLSLANADDLMLRAVTTANEAWDENIALTNEAAQRYETTESKISIMQNGFTEMGIAIYDQFNEPLREGIDVVTELVHVATTDIVNGLPTAINVIEQTAEAVGNFAEPFLDVGEWLVDNPGLITGTIVGIGTALTAYKVVSGITSLVTSLGSLGAAGWTILGISGVAAVITGIGTSIKKATAEAKKASLDAHFGKITLSLKEMEEVAAYILSNDSFGQLQESISELEELEGISGSIDDTVSELNKMNWKISLGMELDEDEQEQYKQNIASYVSNVQSYLEQEQYAISLSVGVLTGEDLENSNLVDQLNEFYAEKNGELADIGKQLNDAITDAFQDGLLDIPEAKTIAGLQQQMANVKASLAMGSYEAELDLLGMKYSGGGLDAETFQNLLNEIEDQKEIAKQQYDEAYVAANQAQRAMLEAGPENGGITQEEYYANTKELEEAYLAQINALDITAANFAVGTITQQYGDAVEKLYGETEQQLEEKLNQAAGAVDTTSLANLGVDIMYETNSDINKGDVTALKELYKQIQPTVEQLEEIEQQYLNAGIAVPESVEKGIANANALAALTGDETAMWKIIGKTAESGEYNDAIAEIVDADKYIPEQIAASILTNQESIDDAASELKSYTEQQLQNEFSQEMDIETKVNIKMAANPVSQMFRYSSGYTEEIANNADGGIVTSPTVSWLAEGGYAESVIPLDGSQNAVSLWQKTGEMLGVFNRKDGFHALASQLMESYDSGNNISSTVDNSEENNKFSYSPTYIFYGDAPSKKDLDNHVEESFEKWEEMMNRWIKNNRRYNFS